MIAYRCLQTFVKIYLEDEKVLTPVGTKRVGGESERAGQEIRIHGNDSFALTLTPH